MTIIEALADGRLFGGLPAFADLRTWDRWLVFLRACYGLPLDAEQTQTFRQHTGRSRYTPPPGGWPEVVAIVGRQSGKTRIAGTIAGFEAVCTEREADGTETYALLIAQDQRASLRGLFSYALAPFDHVPALARMVPATWRRSRQPRRTDSLTLNNGVVLACYPCRPASLRGLRARVVVCDELAFYRSSEGSPVDTEMLRAARPTLATTAGKLIILSSPYGQSGALYDLHRKHFGQDDASTLIWQGSAPQMNPTLPTDYLQRMERDDPEAYAAEVLGRFRVGLALLFDPAALQACVDDGVRERLPESRHRYTAFADPSGGRADAFTIAIAHRERDRGVLDALRSWSSPFDPSAVVGEAARLVRSYGVSSVTGDRYAAEFVVSAFRRHGLHYRPSDRDRSRLYLDLLPLVNSRAVVLLDQPDLLRELRSLERRSGPSGKDRVDHVRGGHDDRANSAAGALVEAGSTRRTAVASIRVDQHTDNPSTRILAELRAARRAGHYLGA